MLCLRIFMVSSETRFLYDCHERLILQFRLELPGIVGYIFKNNVQAPHLAVKREYGENP